MQVVGSRIYNFCPQGSTPDLGLTYVSESSHEDGRRLPGHWVLLLAKCQPLPTRPSSRCLAQPSQNSCGQADLMQAGPEG